jgi:hypothetical protein
MLQFYKDSGTQTLEECVPFLRTQLLAASSLSSSPKPIVKQLIAPPPVPVQSEAQIPPPDAPVPDSSTKPKSKSQQKKGKGGKAAEAEQAVTDAPPPPVEVKPVEPEEVPFEVVFSPTEIENIIRFVTAGFFRHFKLYKFITTHPRRCVPKQYVYKQVVTPVVPVPFSQAQPKPETPRPPTPAEEHKETPEGLSLVVLRLPSLTVTFLLFSSWFPFSEERIQRLVTEAITKSLSESKDELSTLLHRQEDVILKKVRFFSYPACITVLFFVKVGQILGVTFAPIPPPVPKPADAAAATGPSMSSSAPPAAAAATGTASKPSSPSSASRKEKKKKKGK